MLRLIAILSVRHPKVIGLLSVARHGKKATTRNRIVHPARFGWSLVRMLRGIFRIGFSRIGLLASCQQGTNVSFFHPSELSMFYLYSLSFPIHHTLPSRSGFATVCFIVTGSRHQQLSYPYASCSGVSACVCLPVCLIPIVRVRIMPETPTIQVQA